MHASELVELAALVANYSPVLVQQQGHVSAASLEQYWSASKCRLDRWIRAFKSHESILHGATATERREHWTALRGMMEEVLTGEVLTRVWTAVASAFDLHNKTNEIEPVARSVFIGHMEAKNRVLSLMVCGKGIDPEEALAMNRLRCRTERWTDTLLGYVNQVYDTSEFAFDADRVQEFAWDLRYERGSGLGRHTWPIILSSLRAAFKKGLVAESPNADLNEKIAAGILACFEPDMFDSVGLVKSLWQVRLTNTTADAAGMLEDLLSVQESHRVKNRLGAPIDESGDFGSRY